MTEPANLIVFLSDNHARSALGCYGHPSVLTPAIDRLAARGTRFTHAYTASPLCCPARAALATGRYPHQTGHWDNIHAFDGSQPSWMKRLRDASVHVATIGKLHYRSAEDDNGSSEEIIPMHIVGGHGQLPALLRWNGQEPPMTAQRDVYLNDVGVGGSDYQDYDRKVTAEAVKWLRSNADRKDPWVLLVSYTSSHPPFRVARELWENYRPEDMPLPPMFRDDERPSHPAVEALRRSKNYVDMWDENDLGRIAAGYAGLVTFLDGQIGTVIDVADDLGITDATRMIYTSDHGEMLGSHGLFGKSCLYEDSAGVPLIAAGPGIPAGQVVDEIVSHVDLYPTILESFGVPLAPDDANLPGESLWPSIDGERRQRCAFAEYHATGSVNASFMIRDERYKLIHHVGFEPQLFDMVGDPEEREDIAAASPDIVASLRARFSAVCDPDEVDRRAKRDQRRTADRHGGEEAIRGARIFRRSPPPGVAPDYRVTTDGEHPGTD